MAQPLRNVHVEAKSKKIATVDDWKDVFSAWQKDIGYERCAIGFYKKLLEATQGKDPVTYNIVLQILQDEVQHEEDLQSLAEDLELMVKK